VIEEVRAVKDMIDGKMADRGHEHRNVKLGTGGIREIEFFVQTLQVLTGKRLPAVVDKSTLGALERFARWKLISAQVKEDLTAAYLFLRDVEHKLQMVHDLQTHSLPSDQHELERCATRMGYGTEDRKKAAELFLVDHQRQTTVVHYTFQSLFWEPKTSPALGTMLRASKAKR
jgi:glutamate-ammonia-ligase adenylyltransferase